MKMTPSAFCGDIIHVAPSRLKESTHYGPTLFIFGDNGDADVLLADFSKKPIEMTDLASLVANAGKQHAKLKPYCIGLVLVVHKGHDLGQKALVVAADSGDAGLIVTNALSFSEVGGELLLGETAAVIAPEKFLPCFVMFWMGVKEAAKKEVSEK